MHPGHIGMGSRLPSLSQGIFLQLLPPGTARFRLSVCPRECRNTFIDLRNRKFPNCELIKTTF